MVIYPIKVVVSVTSAYVVWSTDLSGNSRVDYGKTTAYGENVTDGASVTRHDLTITGLTANTIYHFKVTTGSTESSDSTFTTYATPSGVVRTVGSGKDYSTIQTAVNACNAGDTVLVDAGTYAETVTLKTGSAGNYITVLAKGACSVNAFSASSINYAAVKGFKITSSGIGGTAANNHITIANNYFETPSGAGVAASELAEHDDWVIQNNIFYACGYAAIHMQGSRNLIDGNDIGYQPLQDMIYGGQSGSVIRNNVAHHFTSSAVEHVDFWQWDGSGSADRNNNVVEGNTYYSGVGSQVHFVILRNPGGAPASAQHIIRYNFVSDIDGGCCLIGGGSSDRVDYARIYNNTFACESRPAEDGNVVQYYVSQNSKTLNNISYNSSGTSNSPFATDGTGNTDNYNLCYDTVNQNASWKAPYTDEATYDSLANHNPNFTAYPTSPAFGATSPCVDAGGALTTVAVADTGSGTSLVVADARWFQAGQSGIVDPDWIAVGTVTNVVQIFSINYGTNTITLANTISRADGNSVWLYKKSDGVRVLYGTAPDVGAYEYSPEVAPPIGTPVLSVR